MSYLYYLIGTLILLLCLDIVIVLFRLKFLGLVCLYRHNFLNNEYRRVADKIETRPGRRNILVVGDSTAVGPGTDQKNTLAGLLADVYEFNVINLGENGATTRGVLDQLRSVEKDKFFLILIFVGNNDIWRLTNLNKLKIDLQQVLGQVKTMSQKVLIFRGGNLGSLPFFPQIIGRFLSVRSKKVRNLFMSVAEDKKVFYIEKYMERRDDLFLKDPRKYYCWDLLHLNECGYKVWLEYFQSEVERLGINLKV